MITSWNITRDQKVYFWPRVGTSGHKVYSKTLKSTFVDSAIMLNFVDSAIMLNLIVK